MLEVRSCGGVLHRKDSGRPSAALLPRELAAFDLGGGGVAAELQSLTLKEAAELLRQLPPRPLAAALARERVEWGPFEAALSGGPPDLGRLRLTLAPLLGGKPRGVGARQPAAVASAATSVGGAMRSFTSKWLQ